MPAAACFSGILVMARGSSVLSIALILAWSWSVVSGLVEEDRQIIDIHMEEPQVAAGEEPALYKSLRDVEESAQEIGAHVAELVEQQVVRDT